MGQEAFPPRRKSLAPNRENLCPETNRTTCRHENTHHKGGSAQTIRSTCKDCGEVWFAERHQVTIEAEECLHRNVDHRGSNKYVRKTFCKDCGTHIDSLEQPLVKSMTEENPWTSAEEQALIDRVNDTETISVEEVRDAATP